MNNIKLIYKWLDVYKHSKNIIHGMCQFCGSNIDIVSDYLPCYCPHCGKYLGVTDK